MGHLQKLYKEIIRKFMKIYSTSPNFRKYEQKIKPLNSFWNG